MEPHRNTEQEIFFLSLFADAEPPFKLHFPYLGCCNFLPELARAEYVPFIHVNK